MDSLQMDSSQMEALSSIWVIVQHQLAQINNSNNIAHIGAVLLNQLEAPFRSTLTSWFQQHTGINQVSVVRDIKARRHYIGPTDAFQESYQVVHIQGHGFVWLWDLQVDGEDASINSCNISAETAQNFSQLRLDEMAPTNDVTMVGDESLINGNGIDFAMLEDIGSPASNGSSFPSPQVFTREISFDDLPVGIMTAEAIQRDLLGANIRPANLIDPSLASNQNVHNIIHQNNIAQAFTDHLNMMASNAVHDDTEEGLTAADLMPALHRMFVPGLESIAMEQFHTTLPNGALLHLSIPVDEPEDAVSTTAPAAQQTSLQDKIPRPANAYILYRKDWHPIVKSANPGIHNNEISKILGKQWAAETPEVRAEYKELAEEKKREFYAKYPTYRYSPRRPSEIMRRNTKSRKTPTNGAAKPSKAKKCGNGVTGGADSAVDVSSRGSPF
uniref:MAT1-2-1 protein n=2 Tax=Pyricularia TaxID=48558 RepID=Q873N7_PYRGI|nr:HMG-box protein [Pyricularia oryzae]BAC65094.1 MAT1-2-1 [Pyricularia grisea]